MTEKQHDTRQLFQTAPVLKTILDALPVGVVIFDHDARIFYANEYAEQLFGKKPSEPDDLKCGDFIGCRHRFLDEVCAYVDSPVGFYHFVDDDQKHISLQQWSSHTLKEFCRAEGKGLHYPIEQADRRTGKQDREGKD